MNDINQVVLSGRATKEPEVKTLKSGINVSTLRIASNRSFNTERDSSKKPVWEEETIFKAIEAFGRWSDFIQTNVHKGTHILVEGRLDQDTFLPKNPRMDARGDPMKETVEKIVISRVTLIADPVYNKKAADGDIPSDSAEAVDQSIAGGSEDDVPFN